jgi:hypothetical protein
MLHILFVFCFLIISLTGCKRSGTTTSSSLSPQPPVRAARDLQKIAACSLITNEEVGALQDTTITDAKSSEGSDGRYLITQCYYASSGPNLSVSLAVTQFHPNNPAGPSPREQWDQTFRQFRDLKKNEAKAEEEENEKKGRAREQEEKFAPPKKIDGVGEEAFWTGNRFGGALYVLKGEVFIRISVGGPDNQEGKIEKSKNLAQKALGRLP